MKRITLLLLTVAAVLIGAAVYFAATRPKAVQTARARRGEIRQFVDELGKTRLPDVYAIRMPYMGRIEPIELREGAVVKQGEVVARVSRTDLNLELAEAKTVVERFTASIAENDDVSVELGAKRQAEKYVESMESTVAAAESRKTAGQKKVEFSESFLKRMKALVERGVKPPEELERAELDAVQSQVDYRQDVLVAESLKAMQAATLLMPQMVVDYIDRKSLTHDVLAKQRAEAETKLRQTELRVARGEMTSPVDGVVLRRALHEEQFLASGTLLLEIGRLEDLEVECDILSQDVVAVRAGQKVELYGPALGRTTGRGVIGSVTQIYPAGFMKVSSLGVEEQRVKVIVRFDPAELTELRAQRQLGVEYRVRARVFTAERTGALVVPRSALFRGPAGDWQLFVVRGGRAVLQSVEVGLLNDDDVEIASGVAEGEEVILAPEHGLESGARVAGQAVVDEAR